MSLDKTFKFLIKAALYGTGNTVAVNSGTNSAYYNTYLTQINPQTYASICGSCTFANQNYMTFQLAGKYDTADSTLAGWEMTPAVNMVFYVMKIIPAATETLSAVLNASPNQAFTIAASSKFSTNLDSNGSYSATYGKNALTYTYTCTNPVGGSNPTIAASSNCCALTFSWSSNTVTKLK
jgi:hypothetical protein